VDTIVIIGYLNLAGALLAFFFAARIVVLDGRALRTHLASWLFLMCATALLAAHLTTDLYMDQGGASGGMLWLDRAIESALVMALMAGCFFLYGREHEAVVELVESAESHSRRSRRLEAIIRLGAELRAAHGVEDVAQMSVGAVARTLAFRETALYLLNHQEGVFRTAAVQGQHDDYDALVRSRCIPARVVNGLLRDEYRRGSCFFVDHRRHAWTAEETECFPSLPLLEGGQGSFHADDALFTPLYDHDGGLFGLYDAYEPEDGRTPGEETLQLLGVFATVTASAIENARHEADLEQRAVTDGLTGLYNHRHFQETLAAEVERASRYGRTFTLLMMDLDLFKAVNDRLGHPSGDEALRAVARVLRANARATDFVARYGGEEFVMILSNTDAARAGVLAERIAAGVRGIELDAAETPRLTLSVGLAEYPSCGRDRESLIAAADAALLFAKRSGRDMIADFSTISLQDLDRATLDGLAVRFKKADVETLETLVRAIDQRDGSVGERAHGVAIAAERLARALSLDQEQVELLRMAALVCDIGNVVIPVEILTHPGKLSDDELRTIRRHPEVGKQLLESATRLDALLPVVLHHHERWDGLGYPGGLAGEEIPYAARAIAICNAWQAMISDRPYRPALTREGALREVAAGAGTQFDPTMAAAFIASMRTPSGCGSAVGAGPAR